MSRATKCFIGVVAGVILIVAGVYGWFGENSILLSGVGLIMSMLGVGALLLTQSRENLTFPHPAVYVVVALAIALHVYESAYKASAGFSFGWFAWALVPYALALALSCFAATRVGVVFGAGLALALDVWTHYEVFIAPKSSTAALALIWGPLWNTLIAIPMTTFLARVLQRRISD